jgi:hypothetical protein
MVLSRLVVTVLAQAAYIQDVSGGRKDAGNPAKPLQGRARFQVVTQPIAGLPPPKLARMRFVQEYNDLTSSHRISGRMRANSNQWHTWHAW